MRPLRVERKWCGSLGLSEGLPEGTAIRRHELAGILPDSVLVADDRGHGGTGAPDSLLERRP